MIQYLVKYGVDRIQINDAGKRVLETLQYFYKSKPTKNPTWRHYRTFWMFAGRCDVLASHVKIIRCDRL